MTPSNLSTPRRKKASVLVRLIRTTAWLAALGFGVVSGVLLYRGLTAAGFAAVSLGLAWAALALLADNFRLRAELEEFLQNPEPRTEKGEK